MPGGRPTGFSPEIEALAWEYLEKGWIENPDEVIPSLVGLCKYINRSRSTVYDWAKRTDNQFSDIIDACDELRELHTLNKSLKGELVGVIAKLVLGKHGYSDHHKVDVKDERNTDYRGSEAADARIAELLAGGAEVPDEAPVTH